VRRFSCCITHADVLGAVVDCRNSDREEKMLCSTENEKCIYKTDLNLNLEIL